MTLANLIEFDAEPGVRCAARILTLAGVAVSVWPARFPKSIMTGKTGAHLK
jgi:hypothetical protein